MHYKSLVLQLGGQVEDDITDSTTHIISKSYPKACRKFGKGEMRSYIMTKRIWVVRPGWILACDAEDKVINPWDFDIFEAWPRKGQDRNSIDYMTTSEELELSEDNTDTDSE